jgi:hypothetical protein
MSSVHILPYSIACPCFGTCPCILRYLSIHAVVLVFSCFCSHTCTILVLSTRDACPVHTYFCSCSSVILFLFLSDYCLVYPCIWSCPFMIQYLSVIMLLAPLVQCLSIEGLVKSNGNPMKLNYSIVRDHQQLWASHSMVHRCTNRPNRLFEIDDMKEVTRMIGWQLHQCWLTRYSECNLQQVREGPSRLRQTRMVRVAAPPVLSDFRCSECNLQLVREGLSPPLS